MSTPEELYEQLWDAIAEVRDASPRVPNDASTDDIVDVVMVAMAREVRRFANGLTGIATVENVAALSLIQRQLRDRADELGGGAR